MKPSWRLRVSRALSDLRWWLFGGGTSNYRCLTCRLPLPESKSEGMGGAADVVIDEDGQVDYNIPAFLRKANRRPGEPWPNFSQDEKNREEENDRFIFVPLADGSTHIVTVPGRKRKKAGGYVW
jgi:hypothetical protein